MLKAEQMTTLEKKIEHFHRILAGRPGDELTILALAEATFRRGLKLEALTAYQDLSGGRPVPEAHLAVAEIYWAQGMPHEAYGEIRRLFELDPDNVEARLLVNALQEEALPPEEVRSIMERPTTESAFDEARLRLKIQRTIYNRELQERTRNVTLEPGTVIHEYHMEEAKKKLIRVDEMLRELERYKDFNQSLSLAPPRPEPVSAQPAELSQESSGSSDALTEELAGDVAPVIDELPAELGSDQLSGDAAVPPAEASSDSGMTALEVGEPVAIAELELVLPITPELPLPEPMPPEGEASPASIEAAFVPVVADPGPETVEEPASNPGVAESAPLPVVAESTPEPAPLAVEAPAPIPDVAEPAPLPVVAESAPEPASVVVEAPAPIAVVVEPAPIPGVVEPAPEPAPVAVEAPAPLAEVGEPAPLPTVAEPAPEPAPVAVEAPAPIAVVVEPAPIPVVVEPAPMPVVAEPAHLPSEVATEALLPLMPEPELPPLPAAPEPALVSPRPEVAAPEPVAAIPVIIPEPVLEPDLPPPPEPDEPGPSSAEREPASLEMAPLPISAIAPPPTASSFANEFAPSMDLAPDLPDVGSEDLPSPEDNINGGMVDLAPIEMGQTAPGVPETEPPTPLVSSPALEPSPAEPAPTVPEAASQGVAPPTFDDAPVRPDPVPPMAAVTVMPIMDDSTMILTPPEPELPPPPVTPPDPPSIEAPPTFASGEAAAVPAGLSAARKGFYAMHHEALSALTTSLARTRGVTSIYLVAREGVTIDAVAKDEISEKRVGELVKESFEFLEAFANDPAYWVLECAGGIFVMQKLDDRHVLIAIGQAGANFGALRYTMDKTRTKFEQLLAQAPE